MQFQKLESQQSSASDNALFKEDMPRKIKLNKQLEVAGEDDTLMGRLAKRMAARDYIDKFNLGLGTKAQRAKAATTADNYPEKIHVGGVAKKLSSAMKDEKEGVHEYKELAKKMPDHNAILSSIAKDEARHLETIKNIHRKV